jgi:Transposase DDE domain
MIFPSSLPGFKAFLGQSGARASDLACCSLFLCTFLLPAARRSVAAAARSVLQDARDAGWLLRWLGWSSAPEALLAAAQLLLLAEARCRGDRRHVLVLDATQHGQQGKHTPNTYSTGNTKPRPRKSGRRQNQHRRRGGHLFVFALLLTPDGLRIPYWLPFYTKRHCALFGLRHRTQADLAAQLIDAVTLPRGTPVVVVGDTAFEAKQVRRACARRGWAWVVPLNPERRLAGAKPRPKVRSLYDHLQASDFRPVSFRLDRGELAALARVSPSRSQSKKHRRSYGVHHRTAAVHNVGTVALLFSTQTDPTTPGGVKVQKVLISDAVGAGTEQLLRWYSLRWQVELFFREMKSELGMCQYKLATGPFRRVEGWVGLCAAAFCYLEWYRRRRQEKARGEDQAFWRRLRTAGLKEQLRRQAQRADLEQVLRLAATAEGQEQLRELLHRLCEEPATAA